MTTGQQKGLIFVGIIAVLTVIISADLFGIRSLVLSLDLAPAKRKIESLKDRVEEEEPKILSPDSIGYFNRATNSLKNRIDFVHKLHRLLVTRVEKLEQKRNDQEIVSEDQINSLILKANDLDQKINLLKDRIEEPNEVLQEQSDQIASQQAEIYWLIKANNDRAKQIAEQRSQLDRLIKANDEQAIRLIEQQNQIDQLIRNDLERTKRIAGLILSRSKPKKTDDPKICILTHCKRPSEDGSYWCNDHRDFDKRPRSNYLNR